MANYWNCLVTWLRSATFQMRKIGLGGIPGSIFRSIPIPVIKGFHESPLNLWFCQRMRRLETTELGQHIPSCISLPSPPRSHPFFRKLPMAWDWLDDRMKKVVFKRDTESNLEPRSWTYYTPWVSRHLPLTTQSFWNVQNAITSTST